MLLLILNNCSTWKLLYRHFYSLELGNRVVLVLVQMLTYTYLLFKTSYIISETTIHLISQQIIIKSYPQMRRWFQLNRLTSRILIPQLYYTGSLTYIKIYFSLFLCISPLNSAFREILWFNENQIMDYTIVID